MHTTATLACSVALLGLTVSFPAQATPANCILTVEGRTYIDGPCDFDGLSTNDGSFKIMANDGLYFAYLNVEGEGVGRAYWNEEPGANHAHTPLGELRREGACWLNETTRLCATAVAVAVAAPPYGEWDCGFLGFELNAKTYKNWGAPDAFIIEDMAQIEDDAYLLVFEDDYRIGLFEITPNSLVWYSPASGDIFECERA